MKAVNQTPYQIKKEPQLIFDWKINSHGIFNHFNHLDKILII